MTSLISQTRKRIDGGELLLTRYSANALALILNTRGDSRQPSPSGIVLCSVRACGRSRMILRTSCIRSAYLRRLHTRQPLPASPSPPARPAPVSRRRRQRWAKSRRLQSPGPPRRAASNLHRQRAPPGPAPDTEAEVAEPLDVPGQGLAVVCRSPQALGPAVCVCRRPGGALMRSCAPISSRRGDRRRRRFHPAAPCLR